MFVTVIALKYALMVSPGSQGHFLKLTDSILFDLHNKSSPFNSTHYIVLYPQNGHRVVTVDSATSLSPYVYSSIRCCRISERRLQWVATACRLTFWRILTASNLYMPSSWPYRIRAGPGEGVTFCRLNPDKIWHEHLTHLSTLPVRCSHVLYLGKFKKKRHFEHYYSYI